MKRFESLYIKTVLFLILIDFCRQYFRQLKKQLLLGQMLLFSESYYFTACRYCFHLRKENNILNKCLTFCVKMKIFCLKHLKINFNQF